MKTINQVYRQIKNNIKAALPRVAYEIGNKMFNKYTDCVQAFYDDMEESDRYYRTYSTYLGSSISYGYGEKTTGSLRNKQGETTTFSIHIKMTVDPSYLGNPYKDPVGYVFSRTWEEGIHGNLANPQMSPSPQEMFDKWFETFKGQAKMIANRDIRKYAGIG